MRPRLELLRMICRSLLIEPYARASAFEETAPAANIPAWSRWRQPLAEVKEQTVGVVGLITATDKPTVLARSARVPARSIYRARATVASASAVERRLACGTKGR
jgi:hypothetical protein